MFGISFSEIILIGMIALVVLGPKQLPQIAGKLGIIIHTIKSHITNLKNEIYFNNTTQELINTKSEVIKTYNSIQNKIKSHNKIPDYEIKIPTLEADSTPTYQDELDFDAQPELFDQRLEPLTSSLLSSSNQQLAKPQKDLNNE